jgi:hypothetical protein
MAKCAHPDPNALSALTIETFPPSTVSIASGAVHEITVENKRTNPITNVQFLCDALSAFITFDGGVSHQCVHTTSSIQKNSTHKVRHRLGATTGSEGNADDVQCTVSLDDPNSHNRESATLFDTLTISL